MINDNIIIAKNTILLYFRMIFSMIIALYTSRVILQALGIEDYGIYGVVGGVVSLFSFLNSSMTASTSRFLTFNLGNKLTGNLKETFSSALLVHIFIALIIIFLSETIGLWLLNNKLIIPLNRLQVSFYLFQFSVISMAINIIQVPFSASIVSHERIDIYAYTDILNSLLRLLLAFLLISWKGDKLLFYGLFTTCISIGIALFYYLFCIKKFKECQLCFWKYDKTTLKQMLTFSGWDLLGNLSITARTQGINVLINMFFGVALNAANSIAGSIQGIVMAFSNNICMAVKPQIIKSYAACNYQRTLDLIKYTTIGLMYLLAIVTIPIIVEINYILKIWLGTVPQYSPIFCILILIFNFFSSLAMLFITIPHAANKNKYPSLFNGVIYLMVLPCTYIIYQYYKIAWFPFLYNIISMFIGFTFICWLSSKYLKGFSFKLFFHDIILRNLIIIFISYLIISHIQSYIDDESFKRLLLISSLSITILLSLGFILGIDYKTKQKIYFFIKNKFH